MQRFIVAFSAGVLLTAVGGAANRVEVLRSIGGLPAHIAGAFLAPIGFQQANNGVYYVFDRRGHAVYTVTDGGPAQKIIEVGEEAGRVLDPSAFDINPADGSFVVADAPNGRERLQVFIATGGRLGGFRVPGRELPRLTLDNMVLNGVGSLQYTGSSILLNQPERGWLVTELTLEGTPTRTFGTLRPTGHESDRELHFAFNVGLPLIDPTGGFYFVFQAGAPILRRYDARGQLVFERHVEGAELDEVRAAPAHHLARTASARWRRDAGRPARCTRRRRGLSGQSLDLADGTCTPTSTTGAATRSERCSSKARTC